MFNEAGKVEKLVSEIEALKAQLEVYRNDAEKEDFLTGKSEAIVEVQKNAIAASTSDASVLITGETGTGKEIVAHYIHSNSRRVNRPFVRVNCAAIPEELFESELFGYEKGSFTGASSHGKNGKFEIAHGGTILLDEIGELPLRMQAKLLRVLQEHTIDRVGSTKHITVAFRLVTSTNQDIPHMIEKGLLRKDLFYRSSVFHITTPNLRDIREDIPQVSSYLISRLKKEVPYGPTQISNETLSALKKYSWPGNVRELRNVLERAMITGKSREIQVKDLPGRIREQGAQYIPADDVCSLRKILEDAERKAIIEILRITGGSRTKASQILEIHRTGLYQKIKKYQINV
jgi:transcriptional regulator with PAS, ATPase and Fis domain